MAILRFVDAAATRKAALGAPEAGSVFADIANFNDPAPTAIPCDLI